jgi:proline iminopeptidase
LAAAFPQCPIIPEVYQAATWLRELKNLRERLHLDRIHLLGQSWGGMLAIMYLCDEMPAGIKSLILSSTLSDAQLWGQEQHRLISFMSKEDQEVIAQAEAANDFTGDGLSAGQYPVYGTARGGSAW